MINILIEDVSGDKHVRDEGNANVPFLTGDGSNGTRNYALRKPDRENAVDLTPFGANLRVVIKTVRTALDTELDASFPLTPTVTDATNGLFDVDFNTINFADFKSKVVFILFEINGGKNIPISIMKSWIDLAGV